MQHGLHDIYCSAQHDQCLLIIRTFWLHGVVGADLRPDIFFTHSYHFHQLKTIVDGFTAMSCFCVASALDGCQQSVVTYSTGNIAGKNPMFWL
jgi:hypothetical protein